LACNEKNEKKKTIVMKIFKRKGLKILFNQFSFFNHSLKLFLMVPPKDGFSHSSSSQRKMASIPHFLKEHGLP
jgi:hypothetical protein